ncbi:D-alanyl-D-alanine carboxypeptidase family protein [Vannielia litorea]|uniref:serine-type D-Ala-D-Ala carboxypeptidase n=1 Tax=Vannielia litorea TaxID=1217970 RepID=A0A1N6FZV0_9RHOB|nr:D-alanyl-D-alanine carboxypeptidase family protein [Vannielia litorea]SIO00767.1 D-alanyl-D-alanine carboxypeptidase (penicillin-binding protein 5/6) [Vannielia litorea]
MLRLIAFALFISTAATSAAAAFETRATSAWVADETTGTILLSKNAETSLPPASMSKLMTLNMLFEALRDGRVTLDTTFTVSERAKAMQGSSMFLNTTDRPTVEDLIKGIIVQSGNDACVVVAEGLAGTEDGFARLMNERARDLGMENSTFANASGWPNPGQRMSMHDLGILALRLIREFPEYYGYFGMEEFAFDGRVPTNHNNRNPLLKLGIGADGLKTGHTQEAGYGLVGSAKQGNRRIVFVITGLDSEDARKQEAINIVNWAFRQFVQKTVANEGTRVAEAPVWMGAEPRVGLVLARDLDVLMPALAQDRVKAEVSYEGPLRAPLAAGQEVAQLTVSLPDMEPITVPLVAERDVPKGGFLPRLKTAAGVLMKQFASQAAPQ